MESEQTHGELSAVEKQLQAIRKEGVRAKVIALEHECSKQPQLEVDTRHYFSRGVYAREMRVQAGAVVTGRIHKHSQINILSQGKVSVVTDNGLITVSAPYTLVAEPGAKRAFYVHEDCVWTTICGTQTIDIELLEDELTSESFESYEDFRLEYKEDK